MMSTETTRTEHKQASSMEIARRALSGESLDELARDAGCDAAVLQTWRDEALRSLTQRLEQTGADDEGHEGGTSSPLKVHHVGIVARDNAAIERFRELLGLVEVRREHLPKYHVTNIFFSTGSGAQVQFMLPDGGILSNFNGGRGGLHHIAFCAPDISVVQQEMERRGVRFIAREKQQGIGDFNFNFVLPNVEGINVELIEDPEIDWS